MASKRATRQEILQVRTALCLAFPACFAPKGEAKKPLKIGVTKDLLVYARQHFPALSRRLITATIRDYCGGVHYLKAITKGAVRVDLDGNFAGFVSKAEADYSAAEIIRIKSKGKATKPSPASLAIQVGDAVAPVLDRAARLAKLREELSSAERAQHIASMSDDFYYSNGRKAASDAEILSIRKKIAALEAEADEVSA